MSRRRAGEDSGQSLSDFKDEWNAREFSRRTPLEIGCMVAACVAVIGSILAALFII